jgi:hypothetical protein
MHTKTPSCTLRSGVADYWSALHGSDDSESSLVIAATMRPTTNQSELNWTELNIIIGKQCNRKNECNSIHLMPCCVQQKLLLEVCWIKSLIIQPTPGVMAHWYSPFWDPETSKKVLGSQTLLVCRWNSCQPLCSMSLTWGSESLSRCMVLYTYITLIQAGARNCAV